MQSFDNSILDCCFGSVGSFFRVSDTGKFRMRSMTEEGKEWHCFFSMGDGSEVASKGAVAWAESGPVTDSAG